MSKFLDARWGIVDASRVRSMLRHFNDVSKAGMVLGIIHEWSCRSVHLV